MLLPTELSRKSFKFNRGDVIVGAGLVGVIRDVLASTQETGNLCVYVSFVYNMGNSRKYDIIEITPELDKGTSEWRLATFEEWEHAMSAKADCIGKVALSISASAKNFAGDGLPS